VVLGTGAEEAPARGVTFAFVALVGAVLMTLRPRFLLWGVILTGVVISVQLWLDDNIIGASISTRAGYNTIIENPNPAAWMVLVSAVLLIIQRKPATTLAAGVLLAPIFLTGSRLGVIAMLVTLAAMVIMRRDLRWQVVTAGMIVGLLIPFTLDTAAFHRNSIAVEIPNAEFGGTVVIEAGTNDMREALNRTLITQVPLPNNPIRAFTEGMAPMPGGQPSGATSPMLWLTTGMLSGSMALTFYHNTPLQIAHDAGWIAALAWLFILSTALWRARRSVLLYPLLSLVVVSTLDQYTWGYGVAALAAWAILAEATREKGTERA
jgi:hypothetical protein